MVKKLVNAKTDMMRLYTGVNVFDAALARIERLFNEFPTIVVGVSGGKDSTVVFELALIVARKLNRLPLKIMFIDQEAEWQATVEQMRYMMTHPDVEPYWYQIPMQILNATSTTDSWMHCWDPAEEHRWMREKEPYAIKENIFGTRRFAELFTAILEKQWEGPVGYLGGVRTEESPARKIGLVWNLTYKDITWGKINNKAKKKFTFYPIYDWSFSDVWKAIHANKWPYNSIYDVQHRYGIAPKDMRVSNVHHETAVSHLFYMQEAEPETYVKLTNRIGGVDMSGKLGKEYFIKELPFMFQDWQEYREFLLDKLITNPEWKANFRKTFDRQDKYYAETEGEKLWRMHINAILTNDFAGTKLGNFERSPTRRFDYKLKREKERNVANGTTESV